MRARAAAHLKGNIWYWIVGFAVAGGAAALLHWGTTAAVLIMITGVLIAMADAHVDPLALITEDALHPDDAEIDQPPVNSPPRA